MLQKLTHAPNGSYCPHLVTPASPGLETSLMRLHLDKLTDSVDHLPLADCPGIQCTMWPTKMHKHGWDRSTSSIKFIGPIIFVHSLISQPSDLYESKWIQKKIRWTQVATTKIHAWLSLLQNEFCHALSTPAQWNPPRKSRKHIIIPVVIGCSAKAKALAACAWVNIRFKKFWPGQVQIRFSNNPCVDIDADQVTVDVPLLTPCRLRNFRQTSCNAAHCWAARGWRHGVGSSNWVTAAFEPK